MYKNVSLPSVAAFQSSWILLAITLVVGPNLPFDGLSCGLVLGPLPSRNFLTQEHIKRQCSRKNGIEYTLVNQRLKFRSTQLNPIPHT